MPFEMLPQFSSINGGLMSHALEIYDPSVRIAANSLKKSLSGDWQARHQDIGCWTPLCRDQARREIIPAETWGADHLAVDFSTTTGWADPSSPRRKARREQAILTELGRKLTVKLEEVAGDSVALAGVCPVSIAGSPQFFVIC